MKTLSNLQPGTLSKPSKQLTQKQQFKLASTKLLSYRTTSSSIEQLLQTNIGLNYAKQKQPYAQVQQVRIMHSDCLQYLKGINIFSSSLTIANLNSNSIVSLQGIQSLTKLQTLQVRNNKLTTLKGIQRLVNLTKIDASNNLLNTFEGLSQIKPTSRIQKIYLSGNCLQELEDLQWVQKCKKLKEVVFLKGKSSNPICEVYGDYVFVLNQYIGNKQVIVDDNSLEEHLKLLQSSNSALQQQSQNHAIDSIKQHVPQQKHKPFFQQTQPLRPISLSPFTKPPPSNQLYLTQQQLYSQQAQQLLNFKSQHIQELKQRLALIQIQKSQQYKELLKKEAQVQRLSAQSSQLFSQVQQKQKSLSQLHKRLQDMLKSSSEKSKLLQVKSTQIQRLKQQLTQQKLLNAQNKALVKDYQRRLSQLHQKTLSTIQQRTLKQDQLKRKSQQMYQQNYLLMKQKQQMTSRLRQLTELLRQWEFKYQGKINELQATHSHEREEIIRQSQQKLSATKQYYQHQLLALQQSLRQQVINVQSTYKSSFEETIEKHKRLKAAYDESIRNQRELQVMLKTSLDKNQEQEEMMGKLQEMVLRTTHELKSNEEDKERILKELNQVKYRFAHEVSSIQQRLNKALYQKQRAQKQLTDLKQTYTTLIGDNEQLLKHQKTSQQLQQRCQDLQSALDIKTQLLQDKNQTIEQLKQQLEQAQREAQEKVDPKELESLRKKYEKYKKECQQLSQQSGVLLQENQELRKENDDIKEIATQFQNMRQTLTTYQQSIQQKDQQLQQLVKFVEQCKRVTEIQKQQIEQYKRQAKRSEIEADNRERQLREQLRQAEISHQKELDQMKVENQKYRKNALEELQSVFMKLQK